MKKHINTAEIMSELEGSVFFPTNADKSTPKHAAEPIEKKEIAPKSANKQPEKKAVQLH